MILDKLTRQRIFSSKGKPVEITWPKDALEPVKASKYTVQSSAEKPGMVKIIVEEITELPDGFKALVRLDADPVRLLGKAVGYATASQGAMSTRVPPDSPASNMGGPQFRAEVEPEAVDEEAQRRITARGRHDLATFKSELAEENKDLREERTRQQERAVRDRLRQTLKGLDPTAATALLASLEREMQKAEMREAA